MPNRNIVEDETPAQFATQQFSVEHDEDLEHFEFQSEPGEVDVADESEVAEPNTEIKIEHAQTQVEVGEIEVEELTIENVEVVSENPETEPESESEVKQEFKNEEQESEQKQEIKIENGFIEINLRIPLVMIESNPS